ncbi:hypothetical protein [Streptococcus sp. DD13]|uniref:hypothetical protein n=1 Tax=Streptococcus sp. DD13 TaxID=1777881 RepID=UPI001E333FF5|nr:hypothetical protein [Streptococcus sp. DD13]
MREIEGTLKRRNPIGIGCFTLMTTLAVLFILGPIVAMLQMWGVFTNASRSEIEQAVHRSYQNYGLTGQFKLEDYHKDFIDVEGYTIIGTYTENIAGTPYHAKTRFTYYTPTSGSSKKEIDRMTDAEVDFKQNKKSTMLSQN